MFSFLDQIIKDNSHVTCMIKKSLFKIKFWIKPILYMFLL